MLEDDWEIYRYLKLNDEVNERASKGKGKNSELAEAIPINFFI